MIAEINENGVLSISELAELVKVALSRSFGADGVWVQGVVASYSANASGHHYLDLQEFSELGSTSPVATVSCVIWKSRASSLLSMLCASEVGEIRNGLSLVLRVKPNYWPKGGRLSFQVEDIDIRLSQVANLQEKDRIRQKLKSAGLWDFNRGLTVGVLPLRIGLVTAQNSAAESDFIGEIKRSGFAFKVVYRPASTAGDAAPKQICNSLGLLQDEELDLICLVRGGGSMSDLSVFDSEAVVTAVASSAIPVWVGIGHSTDTTLVEEVANRYLDVPQSVARAVVIVVQDFLEELGLLAQKIGALGRVRIEAARSAAGALGHQLVMGPLNLLREHSGLLDRSEDRIRSECKALVSGSLNDISAFGRAVVLHSRHTVGGVGRDVDRYGEELVASARAALKDAAHCLALLEGSALSSDPEAMASRGFALLASESGALIREVGAMHEGQRIRGLVGRKSFGALVEKIGWDDPGGKEVRNE